MLLASILFACSAGSVVAQDLPAPDPAPQARAPAPGPQTLAQEPSRAQGGKEEPGTPEHLNLEPGPSFYPMPSIAADKDAGATYGVLAAFMWTNDQGLQDLLLSASLDYQHLVKWSGELELRYYPTLTGTVDIDGYYAQYVENSLRLYYEEMRLDDLWHLRLESLDLRSTTDRFFGIGDGTPHNGESARTSNDYRAEARFGPRLLDTLDVEATARWRHFRVGDSLIRDLPQMKALYPTAPGIEGGQVLAGGVRVVFDTRDSITTPTIGTYAIAYFESVHDLAPGDVTHAFWNAGASQVTLIPMDETRQFVTVVNLATQAAIGGFIPFWEMPFLGGGSTLRSYNGARFINKEMILLNVEERIRVYETSLFGVSGEVQVAPFFDAGKVFDSMGDLLGRGILDFYHYSYGIGFRGIVKPSFVGRLDVALGGREGVGVWVGLDYPF